MTVRDFIKSEMIMDGTMITVTDSRKEINPCVFLGSTQGLLDNMDYWDQMREVRNIVPMYIRAFNCNGLEITI